MIITNNSTDCFTTILFIILVVVIVNDIGSKCGQTKIGQAQIHPGKLFIVPVKNDVILYKNDQGYKLFDL